MKITIDLRCLQRGVVSGVETYAYNVVRELLTLDTQNNYTFFYNSLGKIQVPELHFVNAKNVQKRLPNKLLAVLSQFGIPKMESYVGESDVVWMPNMGHASFGNKTKLVVTVHDTSPFMRPEFYDTKRRIWHSSVHFKKLITRADRILAVSEYTKNDLTEHFGMPAGKIVVTPLGVDKTVFLPDLPSTELRLTRNLYELPGKFILYLATLEPRKNITGLVKAFDLMRGDSWLVLTGRPGWKYKEIFECVKKSRKRNFIKVLGFVEEAHKPYLMKLANVFAFPSLYEGFGLPVVEAMAVGTPVVTSSVTSLPEIADNSALLVNPYNIEELAFALEQASENLKLRESLIELGLRRADKYTWQETAQKTKEALLGLK